MIEMKEVYKAYPNGVKALNGISVTIHPASLCMLLVRAEQVNLLLLK